jgi:hypothetical protein
MTRETVMSERARVKPMAAWAFLAWTALSACGEEVPYNVGEL